MIFCNILLTLLTVHITPATHWVVLKLPLHFVLSLFSWKTQVKINSSLAKQNQPFNPSSICVYLAVECRNDIFPIFVVSLFPADDGWWNMGNITWRQFIRIVYAGLSTLSSLLPRHVFDFCLLNTTRASFSKRRISDHFCSHLLCQCIICNLLRNWISYNQLDTRQIHLKNDLWPDASFERCFQVCISKKSSSIQVLIDINKSEFQKSYH